MNEMDERLKELGEKLEVGVKEVFSGEKYRNYLDTMSRFHRYSFRNSMLIFLQNPNATYVAGFGAWKTMERSINKGEKGLQILAPAPYKKLVTVTRDEAGKLLPKPQQKEVTATAFRPVYVFDVSQTQGKELPRLVTQLTGQVQDYDKLLRSLQDISPCPVQFEAIEGRANGCYYSTENYIAVKEGMSEEQTIKTLIHEIAHAKLGHGDNPNIDRRTGEVQAESVAYIVCQHFGIDSSQYSFGYVAGWSRDKDAGVLKDCLASIQTVAKEVIDGVELELSREKNMEKEVVREAAAMTPEVGYKMFCGGMGGQDKEAHAFQKETGWNMAWGSDSNGLNGDTWIVYRRIEDLPNQFQKIVPGLRHEVENVVAEQPLRQAEEKPRASKPKKLGVADKLEAAKKQVAERAAAAPPREHTQSRSSGHSR